MSHKSGHIIIEALRSTPGITAVQMAQLSDIETRDEYTISDRLYLAWLTYTVTSNITSLAE